MNETKSGIIGPVKDKSVAAIKGAENIVEATVDSTAHILGTTVQDAARVGGEVETAATGLVTGAIKDVKAVGVTTGHAAGAVAGGAVKAVAEVGTAAVNVFRKPATQPTTHDKSAPIVPESSLSRN